MEKNKKGAKSICLPFFDKSNYESIFFDNEKLRTFMNNLYKIHPELFPSDFGEGQQIARKSRMLFRCNE